MRLSNLNRSITSTKIEVAIKKQNKKISKETKYKPRWIQYWNLQLQRTTNTNTSQTIP